MNEIERKRLEPLIAAVGVAVKNMNTSMELATHPQPCLCYGCALKKAYFDYQITAGACEVRP